MQVVLVYLLRFRRNSLLNYASQPEIAKKSQKKPYSWGSRSFKVIDVGTPWKHVSSVSYDKQQVCVTKTRVSRLSYGENPESLFHLGLNRYQVMTDWQTDRQTYGITIASMHLALVRAVMSKVHWVGLQVSSNKWHGASSSCKNQRWPGPPSNDTQCFHRVRVLRLVLVYKISIRSTVTIRVWNFEHETRLDGVWNSYQWQAWGNKITLLSTLLFTAWLCLLQGLFPYIKC